MNLWKILKSRAEKVLCMIVCLAFFAAASALPASAAETDSLFRCDTTTDIVRSVGESYHFLIVSKAANAEVTFTTGNEKVLRTFVAQKPTVKPDKTKAYYFGFECAGEGTTGVYIKINGKTDRLFSVTVKDYTSIQDSVDKGHFPGKLDPEEVTMEYAALNLKLHVADYQKTKLVQNDLATVTFQQNGKPVMDFHLYQPVKKGKTGIWVVRYWVDDTTGSVHQAG